MSTPKRKLPTSVESSKSKRRTEISWSSILVLQQKCFEQAKTNLQTFKTKLQEVRSENSLLKQDLHQIKSRFIDMQYRLKFKENIKFTERERNVKKIAISLKRKSAIEMEQVAFSTATNLDNYFELIDKACSSES